MILETYTNKQVREWIDVYRSGWVHKRKDLRLEVRLYSHDGLNESLGITAWPTLNTRPNSNPDRLMDES